MRKRKERHHTLQGLPVFSATSVSLPTSSCHASEASATLIYAADLFPSSCQSYSFQRIYVTALASDLTRGAILGLCSPADLRDAH